jgi:hypothetical protein
MKGFGFYFEERKRINSELIKFIGYISLFFLSLQDFGLRATTSEVTNFYKYANAMNAKGETFPTDS